MQNVRKQYCGKYVIIQMKFLCSSHLRAPMQPNTDAIPNTGLFFANGN